MLLFADAFPPGARLLPVHAPAGPVKVWATLDPGGRARVTLINKDARPHRVELQLPFALGQAEVEWLRAPGAAATSGVTLGGQTFGPETATGELAAPHLAPVGQMLGSYSIELPAYSAALLVR
jgi:Glycosyl hydrolase family 79 C-terminal beta domain